MAGPTIDRRRRRLLDTPAKWVLAAMAPVVFVLAPLRLADFPLSVLNVAGIFVLGTIGLNLLTGYTGQVSLGHAFFMGVGAYVWAHFGGDLGLPLPVWLVLAAVAGGLLGGVIAPFALRLRGNYLAIVSLGVVFIGIHVWKNFESVTGGALGFTGESRAAFVGPVDFAHLEVAGRAYTVDQSFFWLIWAVVALGVLVATNIVGTRPGRAMQAVREHEMAAAIIGIDPARYKVGAFVVSSAYAAVAGALYGSYFNFVNPEHWNLFLSIQFIAMVIVGGVGTVFGSVLGGLFIGSVPRVIENYGNRVPLIESLGVTIPELNAILFGVVIIGFLVFEPDGLAGIWFRIKARLASRPVPLTPVPLKKEI
ncbi:MAG: branched-chain amino acid ABC transporter permease [Actinobacteria bacterium]|nr:branched-chain amino acid ABC transporter permease [Actinomycetota bacterium]